MLDFIIGCLYLQKNIRKRNHKLLVAQRLYKASILKLQTTKTELAHLKNLNETKIAALIKEKEAVIEIYKKKLINTKAFIPDVILSR